MEQGARLQLPRYSQQTQVTVLRHSQQVTVLRHSQQSKVTVAEVQPTEPSYSCCGTANKVQVTVAGIQPTEARVQLLGYSQ
jgi:hypothetical protein